MIRRRRHSRIDARRYFPAFGVAAILAMGGIAYISYNANSGLPLQDIYEVEVEVPNANRLVATNEVRVGGIRVGQVSSVSATPARAGGRAHTRLELALDRSVAPLPADTLATVRSASVLGATFVELTLGHSRDTVPDGGSLALRQTTRPVELTDLFDVFDRSTARNLRETMSSLAGGFAGRSSALNATTGSVSALLPPLTDVAGTLAGPDTRLAGFLRAYGSTVDALAPVSRELRGLVAGGAATFDALTRESGAMAAAIEAAPAAERAVTVAFTRVRPSLDGLAQIMEDLQPAGRLLPAALRDANSTLSTGVPPLRQLPGFSGHLRTGLSALDAVSRPRATGGALRKLTDLMDALDLTLEVLGPAQVHCNVLALFGQNLASQYGTLGVGHGPAITNVGIATGGAQDEGSQSREPAPDLATSYYPNENEHECESGNEPYTGEQQFNNPPGLQSNRTRDTDPPPGVRERADEAGLLDPPSDSR